MLPKKAIIIIVAVIVAIILIGQAVPMSLTGNTLTIYVKTDAGIAIPGASVRLSGVGVVRTITADGSGRAQFTNLDAGDYVIRVTTSDDVATQSITLNSDTRITINMDTAPIIEPGVGVLRGETSSQETGSPMSNVKVTATSLPGVSKSVTSDANAEYYLSLAEGTYSVVATYMGFTSVKKTISIVTNGVIISNFQILNAAATLEIHIQDATTKLKIIDARFILNGGVYDSNNLGNIYINNFQAGTYPYSISKAGYANVLGELTAVFGANKYIFEMGGDPVVSPATISGHITKIGSTEPVSNVVITFNSATGNLMALSLSDGSYSIVVPSGSYTITASASGFNDTAYTFNPLVVADGDVKTNADIQMSGYVPPPDEEGYSWAIMGYFSMLITIIVAVMVFAFAPLPPKIKGFIAIALVLAGLVMAHFYNTGVM